MYVSPFYDYCSLIQMEHVLNIQQLSQPLFLSLSLCLSISYSSFLSLCVSLRLSCDNYLAYIDVLITAAAIEAPSASQSR